MSDENEGRPYASWFVGGVGALLILASVWGFIAERPSEAIIGLAFIGATLVVAGAVLKRLRGTLKIGPGGAEITIGEYQAKKGQVVDATVAVEASLSAEGTLVADVVATGQGEIQSGTAAAAAPPVSEEGKAVVIGRDAPPVLLTEAAHDVMSTLDNSDRKAFYAALKDLGTTGRDRRIASTRAGAMYMERRVSPGVALIYRLLDKTNENDPDRYIIIAIETQDHPIQWPEDAQFWP